MSAETATSKAGLMERIGRAAWFHGGRGGSNRKAPRKYHKYHPYGGRRKRDLTQEESRVLTKRSPTFWKKTAKKESKWSKKAAKWSKKWE